MLELPEKRLLDIPDAGMSADPFACLGGRCRPSETWNIGQPAAGSGRTRVLVIDDNEALTELAQLILGRLGREVFTAHTGAEGLTQLEQVQPDVVICDINLPDETGYDVLATLRANPGASLPPFIFMSGGPDIDTERCRSLGAAAVVAKPCPFAEIDRLVGSLKMGVSAKQSAA
jgi:CheY-like chemotaxis protein